MNVLRRSTIKGECGIRKHNQGECGTKEAQSRDECATKRYNLEVCLLLGEGIDQLEVVLSSVLRYFNGDSTI